MQSGGGDEVVRAACHVAEEEFLAHAVNDERGQRHGDAAVAHVVRQVTHRPGKGRDGANDEGAEEKQDDERDANAGTPGQFTRGGAGKAAAVAPQTPRAQPDGGGKECGQVELPGAGAGQVEVFEGDATLLSAELTRRNRR